MGLGAAMYTLGGWALPFLFGGILISGIYVVVVWTLAREKDSTKGKTRSMAYSEILSTSWRIPAILGWNFGVNVGLGAGASSITLWLGSPPYNATPLAISVTSLIFVSTLIVGAALYSILQNKVGHTYAFMCFSLPGNILNFMMGPTPVFFPSFPNTLTAAYVLHIFAGLSAGPIVSTTPMMAYVLTAKYNVPREPSNAPIASICAVTPLLGNLVGP